MGSKILEAGGKRGQLALLSHKEEEEEDLEEEEEGKEEGGRGGGGRGEGRVGRGVLIRTEKVHTGYCSRNAEHI